MHNVFIVLDLCAVTSIISALVTIGESLVLAPTVWALTNRNDSS